MLKRPQSKGTDPLLVIPTQKIAAIQEEIKGRLYRVPQEEEIDAEYEELQKATQLKTQWQEIKQAEEEQKALINRKKLQRIEEEQKRLSNRLEVLINEPQMQEQEEKYKLVALKRRIEQDYKDDLSKLQEQFMVSKEHEIEKIVRKKIEMEKLIEAKEQQNKKLQQLQLELEAIKEVNDRKDLESKTLLNQALRRVGVPTNYISERDKVLLSEALLDERVEAQRRREQIMKEVQQRVNQQISNNEMEVQEKLRALNEKKAEKFEQAERILREKAIHMEMQKKGIDYLVQIELGNAPPYEYMKKNLAIDEDKVDEYRVFNDYNKVVKKNRRFLSDGENRIQQLRIMEQPPIDQVPYNDELKPFLQTRNPESLFVARKIIDELIEKGMRQILEKENRMAIMKQHRHEYDQLNKNLKKTQNYLIDKEFVEWMADSIFTEMREKVQREAAQEIVQVNAIALQKALDIIVECVKFERNTTNTIARIQEIYYRLRGDTMEKKETGTKFNFLTQDEIKWGKVKKGKKNYNQKQLEQDLRDKKGFKREEDDKKQHIEQEEEDLDVQILDPDVELCVPTLGLEKYKDIESQYWRNIKFTCIPFKNHSNDIKAYATCLTLSPFKDNILMGMSNGEVQLYDTQNSPALVSALVPSYNREAIVLIQFGMDNIGHLMLTDMSGSSRFMYNAYNLRVNIPKEQMKGIDKLPIGYQPMFFVEYFTINSDYFLTSKNNSKEKISYNVFTPGITFSCLQPYLIFGTHSGTIMKYNSNMDLFTGKHFKYPIHEVLNSKIITNEDTPFINEQFLQLQENEHGGRSQHVYREFFQGHKAQIMYIGFVDTPEKIITIDREGYINIWDYNTANYQLRQRAYKPKLKYKVSLKAILLTPFSERKKFFPNEQTTNVVLEGQDKYLEYFTGNAEEDDQNPRMMFAKPLKDGEHEIIWNTDDEIPDDDEEAQFEIIRVNHKAKIIKEIYTQDFKCEAIQGYIAKCKSTMVGRYIYMEAIKPHHISPELVSINFYAINTQTNKLKKLAPQFDCTVVESVEFDIVDNYFPFMVGYLFVHVPNAIIIISLATGSILQKIVNHIPNVKVTFQTKQPLQPRGIQVIEDDSIFITYHNSNGCWRLAIEDENDEGEQNQIYSYDRYEYEKLYIQ